MQQTLVQVVEEVQKSANIEPEQIEVKEILIKEKQSESPIENIQLVIENKVTH